MEVSVRLIGDLLKINLKGELDHHMAEVVKSKIELQIEKTGRRKILFDFKQVTFMDSSGVGMIIGRHKKLKNVGGKIGVVNLSERVKRIFEMSGLFNIVISFENEKDAIDRL